MRTFIAAAVAALTLSLAAAPVLAATEDLSMEDSGKAPGRADLGIDISKAGSSPEQVQQFLASLNPQAQQLVIGGCQNAIAHPATVDGTTVTFCKMAL